MMNIERCEKTLQWLKEHPADNLSREHIIECLEWLIDRINELQGIIENEKYLHCRKSKGPIKV